MNFKLKKPDMVQEAAKTGGKNIAIEILMFLGVYFVTNLVLNIIATPFLLVAMFTDPDYLAATATGDVAAVVTATEKLMSGEGFMLLSLFVTIVMIVVPMLFAKFLQKRKMRTLGFKKAGMWKEYGMGILVGFAMMTVIVLTGVLTGAMKLQFNENILTGAGIGMLLLLLLGFLFQGMSEEVLCRSYFLVSLSRKNGNIWMAVVVNAVAFGLLHINSPGLTVLSMVNLILFGIFASIYFVKRGSIWGIAAIHSIWNFAQGNIYGVLVSGRNFGTTIFTSTINEDMTIINGGDFGLEGGILTTIVLVAGCLLLLMTKQKDVAVEETVAVEAQVAE